MGKDVVSWLGEHLECIKFHIQPSNLPFQVHCYSDFKKFSFKESGKLVSIKVDSTGEEHQFDSLQVNFCIVLHFS